MKLATRQFAPITKTPWSSVLDRGGAGDAITLDWRARGMQRIRLTAASCRVLFAAPPGAAHVTLLVEQDGTGGRLIEWGTTSAEGTGTGTGSMETGTGTGTGDSTIRWEGGTIPTLSAGGGSLDVLCFVFDGNDYHGALAVPNSM